MKSLYVRPVVLATSVIAHLLAGGAGRGYWR